MGAPRTTPCSVCSLPVTRATHKDRKGLTTEHNFQGQPCLGSELPWTAHATAPRRLRTLDAITALAEHIRRRELVIIQPKPSPFRKVLARLPEVPATVTRVRFDEAAVEAKVLGRRLTAEERAAFVERSGS